MSESVVQLQHFVDVQAFKYDGTLYRQWNGTKIILNTADYVCCLLNKTKVIEKDGQKWVIKEPMLWFFSKKNFFNTTINAKEDGLYYYSNLASPFFIENNTIKFIDFDYDIKIYPNKPFLIVDHADFVRNQDRWYDENITDVIYQTIALLAQMFYLKDDLFDEKYIWRTFKELIDLKEITRKNLNFIDQKLRP